MPSRCQSLLQRHPHPLPSQLASVQVGLVRSDTDDRRALVHADGSASAFGATQSRKILTANEMTRG
jgi:hypothetical protein